MGVAQEGILVYSVAHCGKLSNNIEELGGLIIDDRPLHRQQRLIVLHVGKFGFYVVALVFRLHKFTCRPHDLLLL